MNILSRAMVVTGIFCVSAFCMPPAKSDTARTMSKSDTAGMQMNQRGMKMCEMQSKNLATIGRCAGMMHLLRPQVFPTEDGGVIVVTVNKLTKYDKDLNKKKEINIEPDVQAASQFMDKLIKNCKAMGDTISP